jgi:rRNA maturation RNase YbeY
MHDIIGDIFISVERVKENAKDREIKASEELHRVMIHGTLHLLGYADKAKSAKALMTNKEDFYLSKREVGLIAMELQ